MREYKLARSSCASKLTSKIVVKNVYLLRICSLSRLTNFLTYLKSTFIFLFYFFISPGHWAPKKVHEAPLCIQCFSVLRNCTKLQRNVFSWTIQSQSVSLFLFCCLSLFFIPLTRWNSSFNAIPACAATNETSAWHCQLWTNMALKSSQDTNRDTDKDTERKWFWLNPPCTH